MEKWLWLRLGVIEVPFSEKELSDLRRPLPANGTACVNHVQRACILLTYREKPSLYATGRAIGVTHQTVERCLRRAQVGVMAVFDDSPRPREPTITSQARTFVVDPACRKPKDFGYPHEAWTTRLLAEHVRERGCGCRIRPSGPSRPGNFVQDIGRARSQTAQTALLPRTPRSRLWTRRWPRSFPSIARSNS